MKGKNINKYFDSSKKNKYCVFQYRDVMTSRQISYLKINVSIYIHPSVSSPRVNRRKQNTLN